MASDFAFLRDPADKYEFLNHDLEGRLSNIRMGVAALKLPQSPKWSQVVATAISCRQVVNFLGLRVDKKTRKLAHYPRDKKQLDADEVTLDRLGGRSIEPSSISAEADALVQGVIAADKEIAHLTYTRVHHVKRERDFDEGRALYDTIANFGGAVLRISRAPVDRLRADLLQKMGAQSQTSRSHPVT